MTKISLNRNISVFESWRRSALLVIAIFAFAANVSAQTINTTAVSGFLNNNGSGTVTFNFQNTNAYAVNITDIEGIVGTAGLTSADIWYKTTPVNGPPGAMSVANGWVLGATGTFTGVANSTTLVTQPMLTGISVTIPAGVTYGMAISAYSLTSGRQRYHTMVTPNIPLTTVSAGGCNILMGTNISYATGAPPTAPSITPRGWLGKLTFTPAAVCSSPPTPGAATAIPSSGLCVGSNIALSLSGASGGTGQTYQWQSSALIGGPYTNLGSSSMSPSLNTPATATLYYRCEVTCSGNSQLSVPVIVSVNSPFPSGTYTINSAIATGGSNFQTFTAAAAALSCGIAGPIILNVLSGSGPYNEQVSFPVIGGSSAVNTITINGNNCLLTFSATLSTAPSTLELNGTDYMIINNLNVTGTGVTYAFACHLWNQADNNTFTNCTFNVPTTGTTSTLNPFSLSGSATSPTLAGISGNNNVLNGCIATGGYYGITLVGQSAAIPATGNQVLSCTIQEFYFYGMYNANQNGAINSGCIIGRPTRIELSTFYGIYLSSCINHMADKNRIRKSFSGNTASTSTSYGIYLTGDASVGNENKFINNLISEMNGNGTVYGIYATGADYWQAYHNTISLDHTAATTTSLTNGIYASGTLAYDIRNNIISITRGGVATNKHCLYFTTPAIAICNYNNLYINAPGTINIGYNGASYASLTNWQTASGYDGNSASFNPLFIAPGTEDYTPSNGLVNDICTSLGVLTDISNAARSVTTPDPGAYEFSLGGLDAGISWVSPTSPSLVGLFTVTVNIVNTQAQTITSLNLSYNDGSGPVNESFTGLNIPSGSNQNISFTVPYNLVSSVSIAANIVSVNGVPDALSGNNTVIYSLCISLAGTYTINSAVVTGGTNFQTFNSAVAALACGISNPVVFNVVALSGPYTEQVSIPAISGASAVNTVTFNGNGNVLTFASSSSAAPHTLVFNGADFINVNNLIITGTGASFALSCHLWNQADNNTFTNCTFNAPTTGTVSTLNPFSISGSGTSPTTAGISGNNNVLNGCTANGGYYGITLIGQSIAIPATGNQVLSCIIKEFYFYGLYNANQNGAVNRSCIIERPTRVELSTFYGIYVSSSINHMADKNRIRKSFSGNTASTSTCYGIYISGDASVGNENKFINNLISDMNGNGSLYGIYATGADYWQAYHNTISLDHTAATTTSLTNGIYSSGTLAYDVRNNIITVSRGGAATNKHCLYFTTAAVATCNYNNLYINAPGTTNVGYNGTSYATLGAWQGASGYDGSSVSANPSYISPATQNYRPSSSALDNICVGLGVADDITNLVRSVVDPDPGAYEFALSPKDVGATALAAPAATGCFTNAETISVEIRNYGTTLLDFNTDLVTVTVNVTGATTATLTGTPTGTLAVGATMNVPMSTTLDMTPNGTYTFDAFTTLATDGNNANDLMLTEARIVAPVAGVVSSSQTTICVSGTPTLTVTGASAGSIQWQESAISVTGPWTNVGTNATTYTPSTFTQIMYYQALTICNANSVASNVVTVTLVNPQIISTAPATRCGLGSITLGATGTGQGTVSWYANSTGGSSLATGISFTTNVNNSTTFYAEENIGGGGGSASALQITEIDLGGNDQFEIQNVSPDPLNVTGWKVAVSNSYTDITSVNANIQTLSGTMSPGQTMTWTDLASGPNYWGSNILWNPGAFPTFTGWAIIVDNNNIIKDFVVMNWPSANIQGATVIIGGTPFTIGTQWSGNGIDITTVAGTQSVSRQGTLDNNTLSDFSIINLSLGTTNPGMTIPFTGFGCASPRVAVTATVTPAPLLNVVAADIAVCSGNSTTVSVNSLNDPDYTYSWTSNPAGFTASGAGPHTVSPVVTTKYIVTATDNTAGPNAGCVAIDSVQVNTGVALLAGTAAASQNSYCVSGAPSLVLAGSDGGATQWQSSTVSATGPWTNVGTNSFLYNPGTLTQTTYFQALTFCQSNSVTSNVVTVAVLTPTITSTTPATRCGSGPVTLQATGSAGTTLNWYSASTGGASLGTGGSFTTNVLTSTNYYVGATTGTGGTQTTTMPAQSATFAGSVRGYWFTAPANFTMTGLNVPLAGTGQSITVVRFTGNTPPPTFSATTNAFTTLFLTQNNPASGYIPCSISINAGDVIGILGQVGAGAAALTSYGPATNPVNVTIAGSSVPLTRMLMQFPLSTTAPTALSQEIGATVQIGRVEFEYNTGCESIRTAVPVTINPSPSATITAGLTTVCAGNSTTVNVSSANDPDYTYTWSSTPAGFSASGPGPHTVTPAGSVLYEVYAVDNTAGPFAGCGAYASVNIGTTVNNLGLTATATPASVCPGQNAQLNAVATSPGYVMSTNCGVSFIDIAATGTSIGTPGDDLEYNITFPSFTFNGIAYTTARVGFNGIIALGSSTGDVGLTNAALPSTANTAGNVFLAPYWDDLDINLGGTIKTQTVGNIFIVQWTGIDHNAFTTGAITFQVQMNLTTGAVAYIYPDAVFGSATYDFGLTATIGIQYNATSALQYSFNSASLVNGISICFTPNSPTLIYDWTLNSTFLSATTIANPIAQAVTSSQSYTVVITDVGNGCTKSAVVPLTVNPLPVPLSSSTSPVCAGASLSLFGSNQDPLQPSNNYLWTGPGGYNNVVQNPLINGTTVANSGYYVVAVTNSFGCTKSDSTLVDIVPPPALSILSQTNVSCNGGNDGAYIIVVTNDPNPGSTFYNFDGVVDTAGFYTGVIAGTYTVQVTDGIGCLNSIQVVITEPDLLTVTGGSNTPVCTGTSLNLTATPAGGTAPFTYSWTGPNGFASTLQNPTIGGVSALEAGQYDVTITDANGCTGSGSTVVAITNSPTATVSLGSSSSVCLGGNATVEIAFTGTGPWSYTLTGSGGPYTGTTSSNPESVSVTPAASGTQNYSVTTVSDANCPMGGTASGTATVFVSTSGPIGGVGTITSAANEACLNTVLLITTTPVSGQNIRYSWNTGSNSGVVLYSTSPGGPFVAPPFETVAPQVYAQFGSLGNSSGYNVCTFGTNGCGSTNNRCIWIRGTVSIPGAIVGSTVACPSTTLSYSCGSSVGATTYTWTLNGSTGAITSGQGTTNVQVTFPSGYTTGQLCVTASLACGGSSTSAPRCMTIANGTPLLGSMNGTFTVCPGATNVAFNVPASPGAASYTWTVPAGASITGGQGTNAITVTFGPTYVVGNICVYGTSTCGIQSLLRCRTVVSNKPNTPGNIVGASTGVCGQTITYSVAAVAGATSYTWSITGGASFTTANGSTSIDVLYPGGYTTGQLCVTANNGCGSSAPRCVTIKGTPANPGVITGPTTVCANDASVAYSIAAVAGATSYVWTLPAGATFVSGQGSVSIVIDYGVVGGTITVVASSPCGVSGTRTLTITMNCKLSSSTLPGATVNAYPNPVSTQLNVELDAIAAGTYSVELIDGLGRVIHTSEMVATVGINNNTIDVATFAKGVYTLSVKNADGFAKQIRIAVQ